MSFEDPHSRETRGAASELKFVIDAEKGERIVDWARDRLPADPHGGGPFGDEYRVTSLYFDTANLDVLHQRGSFGRSKYRVRRYGDASQVFLERKLRRPGLLHKRRTSTGVDQLVHLEQPEWLQPWPGQWFHRRVLARRLTPTCQLTYLRTARALAVGNGLVRLTVDREILAREAGRLAFQAETGVAALTGQVVLELKFRQEMPTIFKALVEQFGLNPTKGSKYRHGMAALGHPTSPEVSDHVQV